MLHLLGYAASIAQNSLLTVSPAAEAIFTLANNGTSVFIPKKCDLVAAAAMSATLDRVLAQNASLSQINNPWILGVTTGSAFQSAPNVADYRRNRLPLNETETLAFQALQTGAAAEVVSIFAWVADMLTEAPMGPAYTIRGTSSTAITTNAWSLIQMTWDKDLSRGTYAVIGGVAYGTGTNAFRLIHQENTWRPGGLGFPTKTSDIPDIQLNGGLGKWCNFSGDSMPNVEVFCDAATTNHEVILQFVKLS